MALTLALYVRLRRLQRACEGIAAVEFALAIPIVLMAIMGVIELSLVLFVSSLLEGGLRDAARFGITGNVPAGVTREQAIIDMINNRGAGLVNITSSDVKMKVYNCLSDVGQPEPLTNDVNGNGKYDAGDAYTDVNGNGQWDADMAASGAGGPGAIVVYEILVEWPLMAGYIAPVFGSDGKIPLSATIAVRNEPWNINNKQVSSC